MHFIVGQMLLSLLQCCLLLQKNVEEDGICRHSFFPILKLKAGLQVNES